MALALVTGTSSGIGLATAVALARAGHTVAATMRNLDGGAEIRKIAAAEKLPINLTALNVDDDASVREAFAKVVAEHGPIDVLVNNAGIPGGGVVEETTIDRFRQVMEANFFGALRCIKAVVPSMRERRHGIIVNVTSVAGRVAGPSHGSYAASKWALEAVSESPAQELPPFNVRVAIVEPGVIATPIFTKAPAPTAESLYPFRKRSWRCSPLRFVSQPRPRWSATQSATSLQATVRDCAIPWGRTPSFGSRRARTRRMAGGSGRQRERRRIRPTDRSANSGLTLGCSVSPSMNPHCEEP